MVSPDEDVGTHWYTSSFVVGASLLRRDLDDNAGTIRIQHYTLLFQLISGTKVPLCLKRLHTYPAHAILPVAYVFCVSLRMCHGDRGRRSLAAPGQRRL
jgi:hypothetical protein